MNEINMLYAWGMQNAAVEACRNLQLDPFFYVPAMDEYGSQGMHPRWMVVAEEMRRFSVYSRMAALRITTEGW